MGQPAVSKVKCNFYKNQGKNDIYVVYDLNTSFFLFFFFYFVTLGDVDQVTKGEGGFWKTLLE